MDVFTSSDQEELTIDLPLDIGADGGAEAVSPEVAQVALADYDPGGAEVRKTHRLRLERGFTQKYLSGAVVLDIGYRGAGNPEGKTIVPHAIGVDLEYPGYDGHRLPFGDGSVDCVSSSHCLEHVWMHHAAIRDWHRVVKPGGYIVCFVPHQFLYEKRAIPPSLWNPDHKRFFTPGTLMACFEEALEPNTYRVRHLADNDTWFDYGIGPDRHAVGCYEIELVLEKIRHPGWALA